MGHKLALFPVRQGLLQRCISAYDEAGTARKAAFQRDAKALLKELAKLLRLPEGSYDLRVNAAGPAVSGEVILHAEHLYLQVFESCMQPGISVLYRSCKGRADYTGGVNHFISAEKLTLVAEQRKFLNTCRSFCLPRAA